MVFLVDQLWTGLLKDSENCRQRRNSGSSRRTGGMTRSLLLTSTLRYQTTHKCSFLCQASMPSRSTSASILTNPTGEPTDRQSADHYSRFIRDPTLQLQGDGREPVRHRLRVHQPHAALRMPPSGLPGWGELPEPVLH